MHEKEFDQLRLHLDRVLPDIENFCFLTEYEFANPKSLGRYPRIRIEKKGEVEFWIELWMELNEKGMRYEHFFEEIPYELSAGAFFDIPDSTKYGYRFQKSFTLFSHKHFKDIPLIIVDELKKADDKLTYLNKVVLLADGQKVELGK